MVWRKTQEIPEQVKDAAFYEAMRLNEEKLNFIIEASGLGTWEVNFKTDEVQYSPRYLEILGYPPDARPSHDQLMARLHPDDLPVRQKAIQAAMETGVLFYQGRITWDDGSLHSFEGRGIVFYDASGQPERMIGTLRDITNERYHSEKLEQKVAQRTRELRENNTALENINKQLQSFAYISSHDLQEPLRKIQTFADLIRQRELDQLSEKGKSYFQNIQSAAERMQALIDDLLTYSRAEMGEKKFEPTNLNDILEDVESDLADELNAKSGVIHKKDLSTLHAIPFQMRQLLYNLLSNALKFSRPDVPPHIEVTAQVVMGSGLNHPAVEEKRQYFHLQVSDNGIGFEQQYSERIFELFQRLHGKERKGTGIGLAIVKKIAENHRGFVTADGKPGEGATFNVYFPI